MKPEKLFKILLLFIVLFVIALLINCFIQKQKGSPKETLQQVQVPDYIPSSFVYPNSTYVDSQAENLDNFSLELLSDEAINDIFLWYVEVLEEEGWTVDTSQNEAGNEDVRRINATKDDYSFIVSIVKNPDNKTKIVVAQWTNVEDEDEELYLDE
jgi:hypothetical protein